MSDNPKFGSMDNALFEDEMDNTINLEDSKIEKVEVKQYSQEAINKFTDTQEELSDKEIQRRKEHILETVTGQKDDTSKGTRAKVNIESSPYKEITEEEYNKEALKRRDGFIAIPTTTVKEFKDWVDTLPIVTLEDNEKNRKLFENFRESFLFSPRDDVFKSTVEDENREFDLSLEVEDKKIKPAVPKFNTKSNGNYTGEAAVIRIESLLGKGSLLSVPLWHSGFWITIKVPSDTRLIDMEHDIMNSKIALGRNIFGANFTNDQVYLAEHLVKLLRECIYSTSLNSDAGDIMDLIQIHDLQTIAWAFASIIYPNGYLYQRAVRGEDFNSSHIAHGLVDIRKLFWVDRNKFSDSQKRHMLRRVKPHMTKSEVERYQEGFKGFKDTRVEIIPQLSVVLGSCSINDYLTAGQEWISNCQSQVDTILGDEDDDAKRNQLMTSYFQASYLSQYRHFVKAVVFTHEDGEDEVYDEYDTVSMLLEVHSKDNDIRETLLKKIKEYIDNSVVSLVATPAVDGEVGENPNYPNLIPMDALYTFFTLAIRRVFKIRNTSLHT